MSLCHLSLSNSYLSLSPSHFTPKSSIAFEKISAIPHFQDSLSNTHLNSKEIQKIVADVLKEFFSEAHYNRLNLICQFIDYFNKLDGETFYPVTPLKALETFTPEVHRTMETTKGGSCFEFIENITNRLPHFLNFNLIPGSSPMYSPNYCYNLSHIAAVIFYNNPKDFLDRGFILLDPSFELDESIIIPLDGVSKLITSIGGNTFVFSHEKNTILGKILTPNETGENNEALCVTYFLKPITNFVDVAIKPLIASSRKIPLMTYGDCLENNSDLCIRLDKEIITWSVGFEWKPIITFDEFLSKKFRFHRNFSNSPFLDINQVNDSIEKIISHKQLLQTLHLEYIDTLKENPRNQEFLIHTKKL